MSRLLPRCALLIALASVAASAGTVTVHPATPRPERAAPAAPDAQAVGTPEDLRHAPSGPAIAGRTEDEWRERSFTLQRAVESADSARRDCEAREAPAPYSDYAGYLKKHPRERGYQWVEIKRCDDARADADAARAELADFEEQARRGGVPPGWLR